MSKDHLPYCCSLIEEMLGWGNPSGWTHQDFVILSERILEKTGDMISATTLKRIWGRVTYKSQPSAHSLNTLARFLEFPSWREFQAMAEHRRQETDSVPTPVEPRRSLPRFSLYLAGIFILSAGATIWFGSTGSEATAPGVYLSGPVPFHVHPVATGVPNTVVFDYDLSRVEADSFFIQQSWDRSRRSPLDPNERTITSIYYYPGYFNAKLVANDSILVEAPVHVTTNGWLAIIHQDPVPVYLPDEAWANDGALALSKHWLLEHGYNPSELGITGFYNVGNLSHLSGDDLSTTFRLINTSTLNGPCKGTEVILRGNKSLIYFSMGIPGCAGKMHVMASDVYLDGSNNDLSTLGADFTQWQDIRVSTQNKTLTIQTGTNPPFEVAYTEDIGHLVGIWFRFEGSGAIDELQLQNHDE